MLRRNVKSILVLAALFFASMPASGTPITYVYEGIGTGTLGGSAFSTSFVITASADTANIKPWSPALGGPQNTHISTSIQITGLGLFGITTDSHTWLIKGGGSGGLGEDLSANWMTLSSPALVGYGLDTAFGPVTDSSPVNINQFRNVATTGGSLTFSSVDEVTFSAVLVAIPEPESYAMLLAGLGLLGFFARRRKRNAA